MAIPQFQPLLKVISISRSRFLYGIEQVPEDRLTWSPGGSARSPIGLADRMAAVLGAVSHLYEHRVFPPQDTTSPPPSATLEEARERVGQAFDRISAQVDALQESELDAIVPAPWGESPLGVMVWMLPVVIGYFQGQLNYAQMIYGDDNVNVPPNWGRE